MQRIIIYTCITNNYDWLLPPIWNAPGVRHICFTDDLDIQANGWEVFRIPAGPEVINGTLANRYCKIFPWKILPEHDWSLYIDANVRVIADPSPIIAETHAAGAELAIPRHPTRADVWQEAEACRRLEKIARCERPVLEAQLARYQRRGLPQASGLTENNIIVRSGESVRLMPVMERWWEELRAGVQRDQLSLPYILWETATPIYRLPYSARDANPYFRRVTHRRERCLYNYVEARRYHGVINGAVFQCARIIRALGRRVKAVARKT